MKKASERMISITFLDTVLQAQTNISRGRIFPFKILLSTLTAL
jgi:hypothetical protein